MKVWQVWLSGVALSLPALFMAAAGAAELRDGAAVETVFPVPLYQSINRPMPKAAYADAVRILRDADKHDGDAQISRAEAMSNLGYPPQQVLRGLEEGLNRAPASVQGWVYYAWALAPLDPAKASQALGQASALAPYDYFWAGARTRLAARLWPYLNDAARNEALRQVRALWEEPEYRDQLPALLATAGGGRLVVRAFGDAPTTLIAIDRWLRARQHELAAPGH